MSPKVSANTGQQHKTAWAVNGSGRFTDGDDELGGTDGRSVCIDERVTALNTAYREDYLNFFRYAVSLIGSQELAHDTVQQAFVNTLSTVERGHRIYNVSAFLKRCVRNICLDLMRREPLVSIEQDGFDKKEPDILIERSTGSTAEIRDQCRRVESIIDELPPNQRSVFLLVELRGLGYKEVADISNSSIDSVRQLLHRARRQVRTAVGNGNEWSGALPVLGADRILSPGRETFLERSLAQIKEKIIGAQSWLGNLAQQTAEPTLSPSASFIVGAIAIVIATGQLGPVSPEPGPVSATDAVEHAGTQARPPAAASSTSSTPTKPAIWEPSNNTHLAPSDPGSGGNTGTQTDTPIEPGAKDTDEQPDAGAASEERLVDPGPNGVEEVDEGPGFPSEGNEMPKVALPDGVGGEIHDEPGLPPENVEEPKVSVPDRAGGEIHDEPGLPPENDDIDDPDGKDDDSDGKGEDSNPPPLSPRNP